MSVHKNSNSDPAAKLLAEWRAGKDPLLVLQEYAQLVAAQKESAREPIRPPPTELSGSSTTESPPVQLPLLDETVRVHQDGHCKENEDDPHRPEKTSTWPFSESSWRLPDALRAGLPYIAPSDLCGPPNPAELLAGQQSLELPPPTPRAIRNEEMLLAKVREHMHARARARAIALALPGLPPSAKS